MRALFNRARSDGGRRGRGAGRASPRPSSPRETAAAPAASPAQIARRAAEVDSGTS